MSTTSTGERTGRPNLAAAPAEPELELGPGGGYQGPGPGVGVEARRAEVWVGARGRGPEVGSGSSPGAGRESRLCRGRAARAGACASPLLAGRPGRLPPFVPVCEEDEAGAGMGPLLVQNCCLKGKGPRAEADPA